MPDLGQIANVLGTALLSGAGPSGRAAATNMLTQQRDLAYKQQEAEAERLRQEQQDRLAMGARNFEALATVLPSVADETERQKIGTIMKGIATEFQGLGFKPETIDALVAAPPDVKTEKALSTIGKLEQDYREGRISDDAYKAAIRKETYIAPKEPKVNPIITLIDPKTREFKSVRRDGPNTDKLLAEGWVETDFSSETGDISKGDASKRKTEFSKARENNTFLGKRIDRAIELAQKPGAMRGTIAAIANVAESVSDQFAQATGKRAFEGSKVNADFVNVENPATRAALINGKLDANLVTVAFLLAQINNPDGKISDQDVREANNMIKGDQGSIPVLIQSLEEVKRIGNDRISAMEQTMIEDGIISGESASNVPEYVRGPDGVWRQK